MIIRNESCNLKFFYETRVIKLLTLVFLLMSVNLSVFALSEANANEAVTYYVSPSGQDATGYGTDLSTPFKTIQYAADRTNPGDTVYVMNGTYNETNSNGVFTVTRSGSTGNYITYKAYPGHTPKLHTSTAWNHIVISSASNIRIEGFEIAGNNANLSVSAGEARYNHFINNRSSGTVDWNYVAQTNTNGIYIRKTNATSAIPKHIVIVNNKVHDVPGGGISAEDSDYITLENNTVYNNSWYTFYATSGFSFLTPMNSDNHTTGYKMIIRNNRSYNNKTLVKWEKIQNYSDGNGIIIDSTKVSNYSGKILVANNIVYNNGGSGIHSYDSANVDIINNSSFQNNTELNYGEIYAQDSTNVNLFNNIMYARAGKKINPNLNNSNVKYNYNI